MILNSSRKLLRNYDIELFFADIFAKLLQTYCWLHFMWRNVLIENTIIKYWYSSLYLLLLYILSFITKENIRGLSSWFSVAYQTQKEMQNQIFQGHSIYSLFSCLIVFLYNKNEHIKNNVYLGPSKWKLEVTTKTIMKQR